MLASTRMLGVFETRELQLVPNGKLKSLVNEASLNVQSSTCVPNTSRVHILAPINNPNICPLWVQGSERWELRSRPLGCHVSTITFLTCIISVLSTFVVIVLVAMIVKTIPAMKMRWKTRSEGWWRFWRYYRPSWWRGWRFRLIDLGTHGREPEERPLLGEA